MKTLSTGAEFAWRIAGREAAASNFRLVEREHLFGGLMSLDKIVASAAEGLELKSGEQQALDAEASDLNDVLRQFGLAASFLRRAVREGTGKGRYVHSGEMIHRSEACRKVFERAEELSATASKVNCLHLLGALLEDPGDVIAGVLSENGVEPADLREKALASAATKIVVPAVPGMSTDEFKSVRQFSHRMGVSVLTVVFDDIVGSTAMFQEMGESKWHRLRNEHDDIVREIVKKGGSGDIVKSTGDGLLLTFTAPSAAVESALDIQDALRGHDTLKVRIGMDMGQIKMAGEGDAKDIFGLRVATAARITGMAQGGHVLTSKAVHEEARRWLDEKRISWQFVGSRCFKPGEPTIDIHEAYDPRVTVPMPRIR